MDPIRQSAGGGGVVTAATDGLLALTMAPWRWEWVPSAARGGDVRSAWTEHLVALFADWTSDGMTAPSGGLPGEDGPAFPLSADLVGRGVAAWLLDRADLLPPWARLAWGAVFLDERPRWAPVPVVVEFRRAAAVDTAYLMDELGAKGLAGDAREPVIDYVTTPAGEGVRVLALARTAEGAAYCRLNAALRLEAPSGCGAAGGAAGRGGMAGGVDGVDVLLTALVFELGLMALIGQGVEQLMRLIAVESVQQPDGGQAWLRFTAAAEEATNDRL